MANGWKTPRMYSKIARKSFLNLSKEKCAKESQRHGDYGKKASTAHFDGGARNVARNGVG